MMKIEHQTKYKCDGCGAEEVNPAGWSSLVPMLAGGMTITIGSGISASRDYCAACLKKMYAAIKP